VPSGKNVQLRILAILYQPEATGEFNLWGELRIKFFIWIGSHALAKSRHSITR
jgi:hypothetical protein